MGNTFIPFKQNEPDICWDFGLLEMESSQKVYFAIKEYKSNDDSSSTIDLLLSLAGFLRLTGNQETGLEDNYWYCAEAYSSGEDAKNELKKGNLPLEKNWKINNPYIYINGASNKFIANEPRQIEITLPIHIGTAAVHACIGNIVVTISSQPNLLQAEFKLESQQIIDLDSSTLTIPLKGLRLGIIGLITDGFLVINKSSQDNRYEIKATISKDFKIKINNLLAPLDSSTLIQLPTAENEGLIFQLKNHLSFNWQAQALQQPQSIEFDLARDSKLNLTGFSPVLKALSEKVLSTQLCAPTSGSLFSLKLESNQPLLTGKLQLKLGESLQAIGELGWNLNTGGLKKSRFIFYIEPDEARVLDMDILAIYVPKDFALTCDFSSSEITLNTNEAKESALVLIPGSLKSWSTNEQDKSSRFIFILKPPPEETSSSGPAAEGASTPKGKSLISWKKSGISLYAELSCQEVSMAPGQGTLQPLKQSEEMKKSEIQIIDSEVRKGGFYAMTQLPGFKNPDVRVMASMSFRQIAGSKQLVIHAELRLERISEEPLGELAIGGFEAAIDHTNFTLEWEKGTERWALRASVDGRLSLKNSLPEILMGMSRENPIKFLDFPLVHTVEQTTKLSLKLGKDPTLDLLNGTFTARWSEMEIEINDGILSKVTCKNSTFQFNQKGALQIEISAGDFSIENPGSSPSLTLGSDQALFLQARIGDNVCFNGQMQCENKTIGVAGHLEIDGLPAISALLFMDQNQKNTGEIVTTFCIYAETKVDVQLYPGVYMKSIGIGLGINRCLTAVGLNPSPLQLLDRMDQLDPGKLKSWGFVPQGGTYLSLVGTLTIAAVAGDKPSPFVLWMLLCLDSNGVFTAAGKLWLASKESFTRQYSDRPAVVASMVVIPQRRLLQLYGTTRSNPAIENDPGLANILSNCRVRFSYIMSPSLLDYYLEEVSFTTRLLGVPAKIKGSYRMAVTAKGALMRANLLATAKFHRDLSGGNCGAKLQADLRLEMELAGLIDEQGSVAYAMVEAKVVSKASLWLSVKIPVLGRKRFQKSANLNVFLTGTLAFDARGETGFVGEAKASFNFGGFHAAVDASITINELMVRATRSRVAAFERDVNRVRHLATTSHANQQMKPPIWLLRWREITENGTQPKRLQVVVVPSGIPDKGTDWFGILQDDRKKWEKCIKKMTIQLGDQPAVEWNFSTLKSPDYWDESEKNTATDLDWLVYQASFKAERDQDIHWLSAKLIQDPRLQTGMRSWWREEDQARLIPGVYPVEFRPVEEVEAAGLADATVEDVICFEEFNRRSRRIGRHGLDRLDIENQQIEVARGCVVEYLLDRLAEDGSTEANESENLKYYWPTPLRIKVPEEKILEAKVTITFDDDSENKFTQVLDPTINLCGLEPCTPRQRTLFAPKQADASKLTGIHEVQLPIRFNVDQAAKEFSVEDLIGEFLHSTRGLRILRRLPGELEATVIADNVQIPFRWLSVKKENFCNGDRINNYYLILSPSIYNDNFQIKEIKADGSEPVILEDLNDKATVSENFPVVEYFLEPIPVSPAFTAQRLAFPAIPLQPIEPEATLHDLVVIIPFQNLISRPSQDPGLRIARGYRKEQAKQEAEHQAPSSLNSKPNELGYNLLSGCDPIFGSNTSGWSLELWAEELPTLNTGYFGRSVEGGDDRIPETLTDMRSSPPKQSLEFKFLVGSYHKAENGGPVIFKTSEAEYPLVPRHRYRFFLRRVIGNHDKDSSVGRSFGNLLTPVHCAISKSIGTQPRIAASELRFVPFLELPAAEPPQRFPLDKKQFNAKLLTENKLSNTIVFEVYPNPISSSSAKVDRQIGGIEVTIQDIDEPHLKYILHREILGQVDFLQDERDFRNASLWEEVKHLSIAIKGIEATCVDVPDGNSHTPCWYKEDDNDECKNLRKEMIELSRKPITNWLMAFTDLRNLYKKIYAYQSTSTFVNSNAENWARLELAIRLLMAGCKVTEATENNTEKLKSLESLSKDWGSLLEAIQAVESVDGRQLKVGVEVDDWEIASKMVAVLRRRLEIGEEIFGAENEDVPLRHNENEHNEPLPCLSLWPISVLIDHPLAQSLSNLVSKSNDNGKWWDLNWLKPENLQLIDNMEDVEGCVPQLTGLAVLIRKLKTHLDRSYGWRLVKRPHHGVQVCREETGRRIAVQTPLGTYLPAMDTLRATNSLLYFANLLERIGFAVDLAAYDRLDQLIPADELQRAIQACIHGDYTQSKPLPGLPVVWLPIENRGEKAEFQASETAWSSISGYPQAYGFLKLAVVPINDIVAIKTEETPSSEISHEFVELLRARGLLEESQHELPNNAKEFLLKHVKKIRQDNNLTTSNSSLLITYLVRPRGEKIQTLCLKGGCIRAFWHSPDHKRHRYDIHAIAIDRYEALYCWGNPNYLSKLEWEAPQPQRIHTRRLDNKEEELLEPPTVYHHSDSSKIQFSYSLPAEGQRALLNHLSAIRSGWHGVEVSWLWRNPHDVGSNKELFGKYLNYISTAEAELGTMPPVDARSAPVQQSSNSPLSLFRGERFLAAHDLPYCFEYNLLSRVVYEDKHGDWSKPKDPWIRRLPSVSLPTYPLTLSIQDQSIWAMFKLLTPSDLMTSNEKKAFARMEAECPAIQVRAQGHSLSTFNIPDPGISYRIYYKLDAPIMDQAPQNNQDSSGIIYRLIDTVDMPFVSSDGNGKSEKPKTEKIDKLRLTRCSETKAYHLSFDLNTLLQYNSLRPLPITDASISSASFLVTSEYQGLTSKFP